MNRINTLLQMLQRASLVAILALVSLPAFADPVYTLDPATGRYMFFDDYKVTADGTPPTWQHLGGMPDSFDFFAKGLLAGTDHLHKSGWSFMNCRIGRTQLGNSVPPLLNGNTFVPNTNYCLYVQNTTAAIIQSPVFTDGIGTLYLDAISVNTFSPVLTIYMATNMVNQFGDLVPIDASAQTNRQAIIWEPEGNPAPIVTITLTNGASYIPFKRELNIRRPVCIKIERTNSNASSSPDSLYAAIDNIRVSPPPSDVVMSKEVSPFNVYPSVNANMNLQFRIDNAKGPYPTTFATRTNVLLFSRWNYLNQKTSAWVTNKMICVDIGDGAGNGELWQPQIPMTVYADAGDLEYYFTCHFNGTYYQSYNYTTNPPVLNVTLFPPENKSPRVFSADGIAAYSGAVPSNPFVFPLRLFPSQHRTVSAKLFVNGALTPEDLVMTLTGTNTWQAKYDIVNHPDTTNLLWYFVATGGYTNSFATTMEPIYWQNTSLSRTQNGTLPYGDNCGVTDGSITNRPEDWFGVQVASGQSSYVLFTLDTAKTNYLAGRGEYQNFNAWNTGVSTENFFTDLDDKYPKVSYSQSFSTNWTASYTTGLSNWFGTVSFAGQTATVRLGPEPVLDQGTFWKVGSYQYVIERTAISGFVRDAETPGQRRNQGVRLLGGNEGLGLGYYQGSSAQKSSVPGIGTITFNARLSRPIATDSDYNYNVAYRFTDMVRSNYMMTASGFRANNYSPETPSISLIAYYQNSRRFYEYRLSQVTDTRDLGTVPNTNPNRDKRVRHEIWKWRGSDTPTRLASYETTTTTWPDNTYDVYLSDTIDLEFRVSSDAGGVTALAVKFKGATEIPFVAENGATLNGTVVLDSSNPIRFGTYGFHSAEGSIIFPTLSLKPTGANASPGIATPEPVIGSSSGNHVNEWYWPSELYSLSGNTFFSTAQDTDVKVLTGTGETGPWTPFATKTVNTYAYQTFMATTNSWNNLCAKIQADGGTSVVIDGIHVGSWRAENITAFPSDNWKITEGWLSYNGTDKWFAHLDASQADPALIQGVRSTQVVGIGSLAFDYRVVAAPARIKIQYTANTYPEDTSEFGWNDITNLTLTATTGWVNVNNYLSIAAATNLYVRIMNDIVTYPKSIVDVRNIVIWNNPTNSPNDWAAYNMKITDTETNKWWLDKQTVVSPDKPRSGYLNNSTTLNTIPGRPMDALNPYIMPPRLTHGLGTVSFLARAFTEAYAAGNTNTAIAVYVTTDPWDKYKPDAFWTKVHTFKNITNAFYRPFFYSHPLVPNEIKAIKLVVEGPVYPAGPNLSQRVCIDEIVVTEAIYARFDITSVKLLLPGSPEPVETLQPLEGEDIGVEAQLTNVLLDPQNIQVWITYVVGTNTWGVTNAPPAKRITKPMTLVNPSERIYRTPGDFMFTGIPEQEKYTVVQYMVWAQYDGNGPHTVYQTTNSANHFMNPSWYFPVDLNKQGNKITGEPKTNWTPYYITYDVPPGSVWINELNLNENSLAIGPKVFLNPYIEIAQPSWMDLTGWSMEILNIYHEPRLAWQILSPGSVAPVLGGNGYGLFVIGPYAFEATGATPPYPPLSTTTTVHQAIQNIRGDFGASLFPGGYRLIRPMGMYEQAIAYDWDRDTVAWFTGDDFVNLEPAPQTPFKYVGREHYNGSLSFTGAVTSVAGTYARTDSTNTWQPGLSTFNWTPGRMNLGQSFPFAPTPGGSNVLVTSTLMSPDFLTHGWQNGLRQNPLQFKMKKGQGTNIVVVAETWFRFYGVTSNNVQILPPAQQTVRTNYTLSVVDIQTNITFVSDIRLAPSVTNEVTTQDMIDWLQQYNDRALAPTYTGATGTNGPLSLTQKYWLDVDPTQTNRFLFYSTGIAPDPYGLWLTVLMATINGSGQTNRMTHLRGDSMISIWAKRGFTADPFRPLGQYWLSDRSFGSNYQSRTFLNAYTNSSSWFNWRLELNDQRLSTNELINIPAP